MNVDFEPTTQWPDDALFFDASRALFCAATLERHGIKVFSNGDPLGRALAAAIAVFWSARLSVQLFPFDARPFLTNWFYRAAYHLLTLVFILFAIALGTAALGIRF